MNSLIFDTIVAFFAFATTRYTLPKFILGQEMSFFACFVLSFCYALCAYIRKYLSILYNISN